MNNFVNYVGKSRRRELARVVRKKKLSGLSTGELTIQQPITRIERKVTANQAASNFGLQNKVQQTLESYNLLPGRQYKGCIFSKKDWHSQQ